MKNRKNTAAFALSAGILALAGGGITYAATGDYMKMPETGTSVAAKEDAGHSHTANVETSQVADTQFDGPSNIHIDGLIKPDNELMVMATCPQRRSHRRSVSARVARLSQPGRQAPAVALRNRAQCCAGTVPEPPKRL